MAVSMVHHATSYLDPDMHAGFLQEYTDHYLS